MPPVLKTVLLLGRPGSGKGEQAALLEREGYVHFSMGEAIRAEITRETELGKRIRETVERGDLVAADEIEHILADFLASLEPEARLVLDGVIRAGDELERVEGALRAVGRRIDEVLVLEISTEEALRRLGERAEAEGRSDDSPEAVRHRLEHYDQEVAPVLRHFEAAGVVKRVDGEGSVAEVQARVREALGD